ncbi:PAX-interacting protein 1 [Senna tora]|uniref:PAX-interacting protein 1 n=1 Tax=Senna tora TaxID=362788 RepID=A0A834WC46_9FABA|nr:PAX-interacting protein 1 [Senna tora]
MGSFAGDDDGKTASIEGNQDMDIDCGGTLPLDSQLSPTSYSGDVGNDNEWKYLENTLPFGDDDDDALLETQPVNLAGETQVLSIFGETQVLDDIDGDEDINTQLLEATYEEVPIDSHCDRMDTTQVLENVNDLSSDYPQCVVNAQSADTEEISCESLCELGEKKLSGKPNDVIDEQMNSGESFINCLGVSSMPPRFTFLRVESLREAALAARNMDLKQAKGEANSIKGTNKSQEPLSLKDNEETSLECTDKTRENDLEYDQGEYSGKVEGVFNKNKSKVASSAVRKLFIDEKEGCSQNSHDVNLGEGLNKFSFYDDELAGLSYVNSQEPGELSQANALDFVDRLLKDNIMEFDQAANTVKNVQENSKSLPSLKGQQILAQRATGSGKAGNAGIYDWDDNCEDEGGGDIFCRRKKELLEGEIRGWKSLPGVQKSKVGRPNDNYRNGEEKVSIHNKRMSVVHSDSRLVLLNLKVRDGSAKAAKISRRNIINDLDEQFNINSSRVQLEPNAAAANALRTLDVGLDTQIAAEAMEALGNCEEVDNHVVNEATRSVLTDEPGNSSAGTMRAITSKKCSGQYDRNWEVGKDLQKSNLSRKRTKKTREHCPKDNLLKRSKRSLLNVEDNLISGASKNSSELPSPVIERSKSAGASKRHKEDELDNCTGRERGNRGSLVNKRHLQSQVCHSTPVAYRTRRSLVANQLMKTDRPSRSLKEGDGTVGSPGERSSSSGIQMSNALDPLPTLSCSDHRVVDENSKFSQLEKSASKLSAVTNGANKNILDCPRRRSLRNHKRSEELVGSSNPFVQSEDIGSSIAGKRKMRTDARNVVRSFVNCCIQEEMSELNLEQGNFGDKPINVDKHANLNSKEKNDAAGLFSARSSEVTGSDESPRERPKSSNLDSATPDNRKTFVNDASPVCMDVTFYKQTCNRELLRELRSLSDSGLEYTTPSKDLRKRRDMTDVRILYSQHLDQDIIKHQKKILARLGVSVATSIMDATHFIADSFMRTRNMLEAIASGKPVVTHLWIESCGQTSCFIDEKNYILRDAKKEKEFGFSMPVSLARAGRRVLITPNTKPSKEIISKLVKAVQGQAVERIGRSFLKDDKIQDDLLILSCEEDYASCVPFLEKGAAVYSTELLLNGIVTQKLEYERYQLFADHVKKTRSSIWLKGDGGTFRPVTKCK